MRKKGRILDCVDGRTAAKAQVWASLENVMNLIDLQSQLASMESLFISRDELMFTSRYELRDSVKWLGDKITAARIEGVKRVDDLREAGVSFVDEWVDAKIDVMSIDSMIRSIDSMTALLDIEIAVIDKEIIEIVRRYTEARQLFDDRKAYCGQDENCVALLPLLNCLVHDIDNISREIEQRLSCGPIAVDGAEYDKCKFADLTIAVSGFAMKIGEEGGLI